MGVIDSRAQPCAYCFDKHVPIPHDGRTDRHVMEVAEAPKRRRMCGLPSPWRIYKPRATTYARRAVQRNYSLEWKISGYIWGGVWHMSEFVFLFSKD